jgi:hypothetical protein
MDRYLKFLQKHILVLSSPPNWATLFVGTQLLEINALQNKFLTMQIE